MAPKLTIPKPNPSASSGLKAVNKLPASQPNTGANRIAQNNPDTGGPQQIKQTPAVKTGTAGTAPAPVVTAPAATPGAAPTGGAGAFAGIAPPGLTPDQTSAFNIAWNNYQGSLNSDNASLAQAPINEAQTIANDKAAFVANTETAQAGAAARGMFNSSIKDGALRDIQATQASNDFIAAGQLSSLTGAINTDIARLNSNWGATATGAVGDAVINAQNVPVAAPAAPPAGSQPAATNGNAAYIKQVQANPTDWRPVWANTAQQKAKQSLGAGKTNAEKGAKQQTYGALS